MKRRRVMELASGLVLSAGLASATGIIYTCDANIDTKVAGTCTVLNTTIANLYKSAFTNANADVYIQYGSTGLGASEQYINDVTYSAYRQALINHESGGNDVTAVGTLPSGTNPVIAGDGITLTSALDTALGLSGATGITVGGASCTLGTGGCYNELITISNSASLYYRTGSQSSGAYDFFSVVEHETDEALGTASCLSTKNSAPADTCNGVSPADLFRYASPGTRSYLSTANGTTAYFSINAGTTSIAGYNNTPNSADYGDWDNAIVRVQNAFGTPGISGIDITNDGGAEIAVLDAVGYTVATPEPGTMGLLGLTLIGLAIRRHTSPA